MLKFLLFLFGVVHAVTEAEESKISAVKAELVSGLEKLSDGDTTRRILLKSAMKTVNELGATITPQQDTMLQNVSDLLTEILGLFSTEAAARTGYVENLIARMEACDVEDQANITSANSSVSSLFDTHTVCRVNHAVAFQARLYKHNNLKVWQLATHYVEYTPVLGDPQTTGTAYNVNLASACVQPAATEAAVLDTSWEEFIERTARWFTVTEQDFLILASAYITAYNHEVNNKTQCDSDQQAYQTDACGFLTLYNTICVNRNACWDACENTNTHASLNLFKADNAKVPMLVQLIRYIKCIIAEIQENDTTNTANAQTTCAPHMSEDTTSGNSVYLPYYINLSLLESDDWPLRENCTGHRDNDLSQWIPFSNTPGDAHGYYDAIVNHADWYYNVSIDSHTFWAERMDTTIGALCDLTS